MRTIFRGPIENGRLVLFVQHAVDVAFVGYDMLKGEKNATAECSVR